MMRVAAAICIALAAACLIGEALVWLRVGQWQFILVGHALDAMGVPRPRTSWVGVGKIVDAAAQTPFVVALGVVWGAAWLIALWTSRRS